MLLVNPLPAQFPPLSPRGKLQQTVGNTNVTIDYSRPAARGREIFGGLVPWDELWITGGGNEPIVTFDQEVTFGDDLVPAGKYHLLTIPGQKEWVVLLISDKSTSAIMKIDERFVSARFCTPTVKAGRFYDSFSLDLDIREDNARLYISWTDVQVSVPIKTSTEARSIAVIDSLLAAPFSAAADEQYARATNYLLFNHRDADKAIALLERQMKIEEREYLYRMLFDAHLINDDASGALATMDKAIELVKRRFSDHPFAAEPSLAYWEEARKKIKLN